jgi:hypothetical protein
LAADTAGCTITGTPKISTLGQKVSFKIKTSAPLAYEQNVIWEDTTGTSVYF